ncbi:hypothetical protein NSA11_09610 [Lactobacillus taiwanensis]|uniref:hypothetical protein n=1 Tax=Lactobacillus taiwanensis TaxID=508451 RepID=UPI00214B895D|nr:hypothetical protein [Lactobacillus taiwanensis]MCR1904162.1 hypothetical protein [Lactobacillus taiwanensis]
MKPEKPKRQVTITELHNHACIFYSLFDNEDEAVSRERRIRDLLTEEKRNNKCTIISKKDAFSFIECNKKAQTYFKKCRDDEINLKRYYMWLLENIDERDYCPQRFPCPFNLADYEDYQKEADNFFTNYGDAEKVDFVEDYNSPLNDQLLEIADYSNINEVISKLEKITDDYNSPLLAKIAKDYPVALKLMQKNNLKFDGENYIKDQYRLAVYWGVNEVRPLTPDALKYDLKLKRPELYYSKN